MLKNESMLYLNMLLIDISQFQAIEKNHITRDSKVPASWSGIFSDENEANLD